MTDQPTSDRDFLRATASLMREGNPAHLLEAAAATARELDEIADRMNEIVHIPLYRQLRAGS